MYESTVISTEVEPLPIGFTGVTVRVLHHEAGHGGLVVLTRLAPGAVIPEHWHSDADETVYVLDGDFIEGGFTYGPGTFLFGKAGRPHGPHTSRSGCTVLAHYSCPTDLDFNVVD
jgi:quercetin dioxygenase-like cupin family protein